MPCPICITSSVINALGLTGAMVGIKKMQQKQSIKNKKGKTSPKKK
jgi:hypothetical protein